MQPTEPDAARLWDMLAAAREAASFVEDVSLEAYLEDRMCQRAVERSIEIVGEAARGLSKAFRDAHQDIEWRPIIAQRRILAHEYAGVLPVRLWRVATVHVPVLIGQLEALLPEDT